MRRERWGSKFLFICAAVGSAAGLGNVWKFPYLAYKYGGGAFLVPYLLILLFIGVPMLLLEFSIGQRFQKGAIEGMYAVNKHFGGVGMMGILTAFIITVYYAVVIAWVVVFLFYSFNLGWAGNEMDFFYNKVLHLSDGIGSIGSIQWPILLSLIIVWAFIYFSIWEGTKSINRVIMLTMGLPILLVVIIAIRGVTLGTGSLIGVRAYIVPDFVRVFTDPEVWHAAIGQIFFTLTLGFGTMIAYGSYNDEKQELVKSTFWTALINSSISLIAGFAIFGTVGFMSYNLAMQDVPAKYLDQAKIEYVSKLPQKENATYTAEEVRKAGISINTKDLATYHLNNSKLEGPGLAFIVYPKAIAMIKPKWAAAVFGVFFFITLFLLGIDSAFSLVEATTTVVADEVHRRTNSVNRSIIALIICITGFALGILFTTRAGIYFLDLIDNFTTKFGLVMVGFMQAVAIGWFHNTDKHREYINSTTNLKLGKWWSYSIKYFAPIAMLILFISALIEVIQKPYGGYPAWAQAIGWSVIIVPLLISAFVGAFMRMSRSK